MRRVGGVWWPSPSWPWSPGRPGAAARARRRRPRARRPVPPRRARPPRRPPAPPPPSRPRPPRPCRPRRGPRRSPSPWPATCCPTCPSWPRPARTARPRRPLRLRAHARADGPDPLGCRPRPLPPRGPPGPRPGAISGYPSFGAPDELVDAIAGAGYDGCSTASNHSLDQGTAGIARTLDRFDQLGLRHAGTARSAEEGAAITTYDVGGATVAQLSYAYGFNGYRLPADAPSPPTSSTSLGSATTPVAREAGAQLVIVSLHWGDEYRHDPSAFQRQVADDLPSPDIDVIVGHHAHVVQPIEQVEGTYVVFGLGNQLANQRQPGRADGLTVVLHAEKGVDGRYRVAGIEAVPTYVAAGSFVVLPVVDALSSPDPGAPIGELQASYDRTAAVLAASPTPGVLVVPRPG
ncbi:MAG: CapA family protein [Acidimicrobiales bacterium]